MGSPRALRFSRPVYWGKESCTLCSAWGPRTVVAEVGTLQTSGTKMPDAAGVTKTKPTALPRAVHMFDHPAWMAFAEMFNATEHVWDQCMQADIPNESPIKSTVWLCTPNISEHVEREFGVPPASLCCHPPGTHKALRGCDAQGNYLTKSSNSENYSRGTNRSIARTVVAKMPI